MDHWFKSGHSIFSLASNGKKSKQKQPAWKVAQVHSRYNFSFFFVFSNFKKQQNEWVQIKKLKELGINNKD
jgi:hypothetical protein